ncbi:hypothetical protein Tco_1445112, partial [Tanacetum coccineum]
MDPRLGTRGRNDLGGARTMRYILFFYKDINLPPNEKKSKALKLIKARNNGRQKAYGSKRAIAYMEL